MDRCFGVDYYPEHWPRERWAIDADLMAGMGLRVARMGDFSWSRLEPEEGRFDFAWLDEAIGTLAERGISTVLATPTAAPPAWLVEAHPEILPVDSCGHVRNFGGRHHNCHSSPVYRRRVADLVGRMADRYGKDARVVAWQIDNELGAARADLCMCEICAACFRCWLEGVYGSVEALNAAWGTVFWSQEYNSFEQVSPPRTTPNTHNPSLMLDWKRFGSDLIVDFLSFQAEILRGRGVEAPLLHDYMGFADKVDYFDLARPLDLVAQNQYPINFGDERPPYQEPAAISAALDLVRATKDRGFWVTEQQAGQVGWGVLGRTPRPGQLRLWALHSIAHGAESVLFYRWRTCPFGCEEFVHGILPHDGSPGRRYEELKAAVADFSPLLAKLDGGASAARAAILYSYEQDWAFEVQPHHPDHDYKKHVRLYYDALYDLSVPVDFVGEEGDFSRYELLVAPLQMLMDEDLAARLRLFAEGGGTLVLTMRAGVKRRDNRCFDEGPPPGLLAGLAGLKVVDYDCLREMEVPVLWGGEMAGRATLWCDVPELVDARPLATYGAEYYAGAAAVSERAAGAGRCLYVATCPSPGLAAAIARYLVGSLGLERLGSPPRGVELAERVAGDRRYLFVMNHGVASAPFSVPEGYEAETPESSASALAPFEARAYSAPRSYRKEPQF